MADTTRNQLAPLGIQKKRKTCGNAAERTRSRRSWGRSCRGRSKPSGTQTEGETACERRKARRATGAPNRRGTSVSSGPSARPSHATHAVPYCRFRCIPWSFRHFRHHLISARFPVPDRPRSISLFPSIRATVRHEFVPSAVRSPPVTPEVSAPRNRSDAGRIQSDHVGRYQPAPLSEGFLLPASFGPTPHYKHMVRLRELCHDLKTRDRFNDRNHDLCLTGKTEYSTKFQPQCETVWNPDQPTLRSFLYYQSANWCSGRLSIQ